jgi:hypothetical protein
MLSRSNPSTPCTLSPFVKAGKGTAIRYKNAGSQGNFFPTRGMESPLTPLIKGERAGSKGSNGGDFTVGGFGLRVVAVVERLEQVIEDAEGRDDFVLHSSPLS